MCGRFNVSTDPLTEIFLDLVGQPFPGTANYNTAPTEPAWIIRPDRDGFLESAEAQWWLVPWWSKEPKTRYSTFNAKGETLETSRVFSEPFERKRCIVPMSGFYEWLRKDDVKVPHYIKPLDDSAMLVAGLWDRWRNRETDDVLQSFTIVTTAVSEQLAFIHNRQPVMLSKDEAVKWLDLENGPNDVKVLLEPHIPAALSVTPVSSYVGNSRHKEATCMEPVGASIQIEPQAPGH